MLNSVRDTRKFAVGAWESEPALPTAGETPSEWALKACGTNPYWCNRLDLDEEEWCEASAPAVAIPTKRGKGAAQKFLRECEDVWRNGWDPRPGDEPVESSLVGFFPGEAAAISRSALADPTSLVGYFQSWSYFDKERILAFGIGVLERFGNPSDRSILRRYASGHEHGERAIEALRKIVQRMAGVSESAV